MLMMIVEDVATAKKAYPDVHFELFLNSLVLAEDDFEKFKGEFSFLYHSGFTDHFSSLQIENRKQECALRLSRIMSY